MCVVVVVGGGLGGGRVGCSVWEVEGARFVCVRANGGVSCKPPLQPSSSLVSHETSCCSEREGSLPVAMKLVPSMSPVVPNAQHEPHWAWQQ